MFTRILRESMKRQEGQALVLACLMVLVLSISVITTINLGHTVHERVRLQNTSDAAAYSMAAMEARAFNFYAFTNRAQVSHYVSAMIWQSTLSFISFIEALLVDVYGVMKSLNPCVKPSGKWRILCPVLENLPYVGPVIKGISQVMNVYRNFLKNMALPMLRMADLDTPIGQIVIPAHRVLNAMLAASTTAVKLATFGQVFTSTSAVIAANDPNVDASGPGSLAAGALSACMFNRAHMEESMNNNPFEALDPTAVHEDKKLSRIKRAMGGITNATRFACDDPNGECMPGWVTKRTAGQVLPLPSYMGTMKGVIDNLGDWKWGQTRMLTHGYADGRTKNFIRDWNEPPTIGVGMMAQGDNLGSDDLYQIALGPPTVAAILKNPFSCEKDDDPNSCWGDNRRDESDRHPFRKMLHTSIWALNDDEGIPGGIHWRLAYTNPKHPDADGWKEPSRGPGLFAENNEKEVGLNRNTVCIVRPLPCWAPGNVEFEIWSANIQPIEDGNHTWGGVVPFPHFEPGQYARDCGLGGGVSDKDAALRDREFNQPSTWVVLQKNAQEQRNPRQDPTGAGTNTPALLNPQAELQFRFSAGARLGLENDRGGLLGGEGLTTLARGQVYYHRPGNWHEHPNFFNPYWRPRLAAVWQGRESLPLVGDMANLLPAGLGGNLITH
jgi:hypothetical protein